MKKPVVRQEWIESEAGWGQKHDGFTIHLNNEDKDNFIKEYWDEEKKNNPSGETPSIYVRPEWNSDLIDVEEEVYKKLKKARKEGKFGIYL